MQYANTKMLMNLLVLVRHAYIHILQVFLLKLKEGLPDGIHAFKNPNCGIFWKAWNLKLLYIS
jgi:hypothetical protein